jgi:hypothetical protein
MSSEREFIEQYLSAYVDGVPLEPSVRERLEQLLSTTAYGNLYKQEVAIRQLLRERRLRLRYQAPAGLLSSVRRALASAQPLPSRRFPRWVLAAAAATAIVLVVLWYVGRGPFSHAAPPCFATALLTTLQELQHGKLAVTPITDMTTLRAVLSQHGVSTVPIPLHLKEAPLVGMTVRRVDSYKLPILVYRAPDGWLLLAEAPVEEFHAGHLWLDSTIWNTVILQRWHWGCPGQPTTCAFWEYEGMICGVAATLPTEQVKQLLSSTQ